MARSARATRARGCFDATKTLCASMRKHCASALRAPQAFLKALCATSSFMLGEVKALKSYYQAKVFHELNASSVDLLQIVFLLFSLHPLYCVFHWRSPDRCIRL